MKRHIAFVLTLLGFFALLHTIWWAFTGDGLVRPARNLGDEGRVMIAAMLHCVALGAGFVGLNILAEDKP